MPWLSAGPRRALLIASFFGLALPIAFFRAQNLNAWAVTLYLIVLGQTHFLISFAVYLSEENRRHFTSSLRNLTLFVIGPLTALVGLAIVGAFDLAPRTTAVGFGLSLGIRVLDFLHLNRQSFGVLQLLKGRGVPRAVLRFENLYFLSLSTLLLVTWFNDASFDAASPVTWVALTVAAGSLVGVLVQWTRAVRAGADRQNLVNAGGYLLLQTLGCALAVWRLELYAAALALHYVEYHLLMGRRVLNTPPAAGDRVLRAMQRAPVAFALGVLALSGLVSLFGRLQLDFADSPDAARRLLLHAFDGLFVFHYLLELSIWKFSDPYFRRTVAPLFDAANRRSRSSETTARGAGAW